MFEFLYFAIFPYIAVTTLLVGSFYRYYNDRFSISSQSSQFLGKKKSLLFGSWSWHWAIITILSVHTLGMLALSWFKWLISDQPLNIVLAYEYTGLFFASFAVIGIYLLTYRRLNDARLRAVTTWIDWLTFLLLIIQVTLGWWIAYDSLVNNGIPGSSWFAATVVPWIISLAVFDPVIGGIVGLNFWQRWHFVNAMLLFTIFPFSRLSHMLSYPYHYLYRSFQLITWNNKVKRRPVLVVKEE